MQEIIVKSPYFPHYCSVKSPLSTGVWESELQLTSALQNAAFWKLCFHLTDIKNAQCFRNGQVHEFYSLKDNQMSKVRASSHEYPHVEKLRIFVNRISNLRQTTLKQLDSEDSQRSNFSSWYLSLTLVWNILILLFVLVASNHIATWSQSRSFWSV